MDLLRLLADEVPGDAPRTAVVVAHPDDEVIGAGSRLPRLRDALFVYVTDGAPQEGSDARKQGLSVDGYRERRRDERAAALALCGIGRDRIVDLDCPDQQAALQLASLARALARVLEDARIEAVLTQPYEGGHPDHDATAFVAHAAAMLCSAPPALFEMSSYHAGPQGLVLCEFLPHAQADATAVTVRLSPQERAAKQRLIEAHASQRETLRGYPLELERFRRAPAYDFRKPPHAGSLWYDTRPWGMSGTRFCELAADALLELQPGLRQ